MNQHVRVRFQAEELLRVEDFEELCALIHQMQLECEPHLDFNEAKIYAHMYHCVNDLKRDQLNCWIVRYNGVISAFGVGRMRDFMFSDKLVASLQFWYVKPAFRKTWMAYSIFHTYEQWAKLLGALRIEVGAAKSVGDPEVINKMFVKRGYVHIGELYYKPIGE